MEGNPENTIFDHRAKFKFFAMTELPCLTLTEWVFEVSIRAYFEGTTIDHLEWPRLIGDISETYQLWLTSWLLHLSFKALFNSDLVCPCAEVVWWWVVWGHQGCCWWARYNDRLNLVKCNGHGVWLLDATTLTDWLPLGLTLSLRGGSSRLCTPCFFLLCEFHLLWHSKVVRQSLLDKACWAKYDWCRLR